MRPHTPRFDEWLAAENEATEAECRLYRAMLNASNSGGVPDAALVEATRAKRVKAHALFDDAMQEMKTVAESLDHRRILTRSDSAVGDGQRRELDGHRARPDSA